MTKARYLESPDGKKSFMASEHFEMLEEAGWECTLYSSANMRGGQMEIRVVMEKKP